MFRQVDKIAKTNAKIFTINTIKVRFGLSLRMIIMLASVACIGTALAAWTIISSAATPSSGMLTLVMPTLTYTGGGPYAVGNVSSNVNSNGLPTCSPAQAFPCDDYTLTITVPPGTNTTKRVKIKVDWPVSAADFDLYVLDSTGTTEVTSSASSSDPEIAFVAATSATYIIRTVPFAPAGQNYNGTITLEDIPVTPPPPPPGSGTPRFQNYNPPSTNSFNGGEPSIGTNWVSGKAMYLASFNAISIGFDDCSSPAKDTWTDTAVPSAASLDPILFTDHTRAPGNMTPDRTFVSQLTGQDSITFFTDNDGGSYLPSQGGGIPSGVDHQTIGAGPYNPSSTPPPPPNPTYPNAVYYCSQEAATAFCARSDNGGITFGPGVPIYNLTQCTGIHGHVKVGPDGSVYVPNRSCGNKAAAVLSRDNGITWAVNPIPTSSTTGFLVDPSIGIGTNTVGKPGGQTSNTIYLGYQAADSHPRIAVSRNQGATWSNDQDVGTAFGIVNSTFPEVVAGDDNRAAYAFFGTTVPGNYTSFATYPQDAPWHLYIATTFDGGLSWTTIDATPNDPVQRGSICNLGTTACANTPDDRNLLDFMDETIDAQGRVLVGYPDGCVGACVTNPTGAHPNSYTALASIARQSGGKRLFVAFDPNPPEPVAPAPPRVDSVVKDGAGVVHLKWSEPDNGGSPLTGYKIYRKDGPAPFALLATVTQGCPACKTTYDDSTATNTAITYLYKVTAVNAIGEGINCREFPIAAITEFNCLLPGITILTDPANDELDMLPGHDVQHLWIAEPAAFAPNKLVFTLKMQSLATVPPNTRWPVTFTFNAVNYTVRMTNVPADGATTAPIFQVGPSAGPFVAADPASTFTADGTITMVAPTSAIGNPAPGGQLTGFLTRICESAMVTGGCLTPDNMPDSLSPTGSYTLVGNLPCPNGCPLAVLSATSPTSGNAPLTVSFTGASSSDPDAGDTIASYTFNFGDGSAPVTQGTPTIMHTYNNPGDYNATLKVTDSRGLISCNTAAVVISVGQSGTLTNYALTSSGGTAVASSSHSSGLYPAAAAINGDRNGASWGSPSGGWNDGTRGAYPDDLEVDFSGQAKAISEIRVYTLQNNWSSNPGEPNPNTSCSNEGILDFLVQTWDGANWVIVPSGSVTMNDKAMRVFTFTAITTSKIRVRVTASRNNWSRIIELEAYGTPGQP